MNNYYFVGIGGIGMSALAEYLINTHEHVTGCDGDLNQKTIHHLIKKYNIDISDEKKCIEHIAAYKPTIIVITNTVSQKHSAIIYAHENNIPIILRGKLLGEILKKKKVIGITGSHGKTSTTGITAHILKTLHYEPSIFIGGIMPLIKSNFYYAESPLALIEADDAYKSFLSLNPFISLITSISYEHLETYTGWDDIYKTYLEYAHNTKQDGYVIINTDSQTTQYFTSLLQRPYISYGINKETQDYAANDIELHTTYSLYNLYKNKTFIAHVKIPMPGIHHVKNSVGALAIADSLNICLKDAINTLFTHQGVERRMEYKGTYNNASVYDDYGHHPIEIQTTLDAFSRLSCGKKIVFFQPHKYSRTKALWNDFIQVLSQAKIDKLYLVDIFNAGDDYDSFYNSKTLVQTLTKNGSKNIFYIDTIDYNKMIKFIDNTLTSDDIILCLGAGKLDKFADFLTQ
jgi:UDP-N-acetylmuramate--alanine ligase